MFRSVAATVQGEIEHVVGIFLVTHIRVGCVFPTLCIGRMVSSMATTCDSRTRSPIRWYNGSIKSATSPH